MTKNGSGIRLAATIVSLAYAIALFLTGTHLPNLVARALAFSPTVIGLGAVLFDMWLWKWPVLRKFNSRPCLAGAWIGEIKPTGTNPNSGGAVPWVIESAIVIEQTFWTISITALTAESVSHSSAATIASRTESKAHKVLSYVYLNEPSQAVRHRSHPSKGACNLSVVGDRPTNVSGSYWTDRKTTGDLVYRYVGKRTNFSQLAQIQMYLKEVSGK